MKYLRLPVLATLLLLAACGDKSPTNINESLASGTLSFAYTGGGGGSYNATGALAPTANDATLSATTWAAGWKDNSDGSTWFMSNVARAGGLSDLAFVIIKQQTAGSADIDPNCQPTSTVMCNGVGTIIGSSATGSWSFICSLTSGTITIASISSTNATGSFSGAGTCLDGATIGSTPFVVTNGSFSVPLMANPPTGF
jgi:hypothetical protein